MPTFESMAGVQTNTTEYGWATADGTGSFSTTVQIPLGVLTVNCTRRTCRDTGTVRVDAFQYAPTPHDVSAANADAEDLAGTDCCSSPRRSERIFAMFRPMGQDSLREPSSVPISMKLGVSFLWAILLSLGRFNQMHLCPRP